MIGSGDSLVFCCSAGDVISLKLYLSLKSIIQWYDISVKGLTVIHSIPIKNLFLGYDMSITVGYNALQS